MCNEYDEGKCEFCRELSGEQNLYLELAEKYDLPRNRMIYQGKYWVIVPTIGAIVPGYLLIVSKRHRVSIRECDKLELEELEGLLESTRRLLERVYHHPCIAFEHGVGCGRQMNAACIEHCHLHVLPLKEDIYEKIDRVRMQVKPLRELSQISEMFGFDEAYLLYQDQKERCYVIQAEVYISQYFRQLVAIEENKAAEWNWREFYFVDNMKKTIEDLV